MIKIKGAVKLILFSALLSAFALLYPSKANCSNDEIKILKKQIEVFQKRLKYLEKKQKKSDDIIKRLEMIEQSQAKIDKEPRMKTYWENGFRLEYNDPSNNRDYRFRIRTGLQFRYTYVDTDDDILYNGSPTGKNVDHTENYSSFNMRRLRFYVDGTAPNKNWKYYVHVQLEPQSSVNVHDAYIQWQKFKEFRVQFGRMKIPAFGLEYWQSGFGQNGTDRTIFSGDSENDKDLFGNRTYDFPGSNSRLRVGNQRLKNGFPAGGLLLYRSQGFNINGCLDMFEQKDFLTYWAGVYNGRDTRGYSNTDDEMLYTMRIGINFLPGSDPKGPMGSKAFNNYTAQGDYHYNTTPLAAFITSGFWDNDKTRVSYSIIDDPDKGFMSEDRDTHDIENYGFSGTFLFRYSGFSTDLEYAWEEFVQEASDRETWQRWGTRLNIGYFIVPQKWELVSKIAYVKRINDNDLENSINSGLGLVKLKDGFTVEDNLQQYVLGINHYLDGFNRYITADVCWYHRGFDKISAQEASALGINPVYFDSSPDDQNETRLRIMYQFLF